MTAQATLGPARIALGRPSGPAEVILPAAEDDAPSVSQVATPDPRLARVPTDALRREYRRRRLASRARDVRASATSATGQYAETASYIAAGRRFVAGAGRRVGELDIEQLPALAALAAEADAVLTAAGRRLHDDCGYSWGEIGRALGYAYPRQSAFKRFGRPAGPEGDDTDDS